MGKYKSSELEGESAEALLINYFKSKGKEVRAATFNENVNKHFDIVVDGRDRYDIKAEKRLNRGDSKFSDIVWLEAINVRGKIGWLYGEADYIAFLRGKEFLIMKREALAEFVKERVPSTIHKEKLYGKWYRREGRLDAVCYFNTEELMHLVVETLQLEIGGPEEGTT